MIEQDKPQDGISRRDFLKASATATAAVLASRLVVPGGVHAAGDDTIRIGLIGCGGRGTGAVENALASAPNVEIFALADLFEDRLTGAYDRFSKLGDKCKVTKDRCYSGFDAYKKLLAHKEINVAILATPPGFRPQHLRAAIEAGKNIFTEKPVAVCPTGVRTVIDAAKLAQQKGLAIVAGTQRRHQPSYVETMKRIHDGAIGKIVSAQCYWNQGGLWKRDRDPAWNDVEWQIRNWLYFTWLSGDHIVEQHVHNLDVINWAMGSHPLKAYGMGGRQARTAPVYGNIYDHFVIEYEYPDGARVTSMCRQIDGCANRVSENLIGAKGTSNPSGSIRGATDWRYDGPNANPYVQEWTDLINSIRAGQPLNEGVQVAESTLTGIMGRMSAYTGQEVTWEQALNSKLDLTHDNIQFGALPVDPVAVPGHTQLI